MEEGRTTAREEKKGGRKPEKEKIELHKRKGGNYRGGIIYKG